MARKNSNAGQPNREAQKIRRDIRTTMNANFVRGAVFGPGSTNLVDARQKASS